MSWCVRFEDIDKPRVVSGAMEKQLEDLREMGLFATEVQQQSKFHSRHSSLIVCAIKEDMVYPCFCSRKDIQTDLANSASAPHGAVSVYSGRCRAIGEKERLTLLASKKAGTIAWRFRSKEASGDFIVGRTATVGPKDLLFDVESFVPSYHWACAIDDWDGGFAAIVRASDLEAAIVPQRAVQTWLKRLEGASRSLPSVFHAALIVQNDGHRLEKRTRGVTLQELKASGWSVAKIIKEFERGFDLKAFEKVPQTESVMGETQNQITLKQLGF